MGLKSYDNYIIGSRNITEPNYDNFLRVTSDRLPTDTYFNLTTLLLHGDGTNATQNNTFVDGSTNNFTITRNGNTTQGTLSPFGDNWSNFFDGNGDNLTIGSTSAFSIATSTTPFTIECWVYPTADGGCIFTEQYTGAGNPVDISINMSSTTVDTTNGRIVSFGYYTGSAWVTAAIANSQLTLNSWTHVACVFTGSTTKIFYNGVDVTAASPTPATTWGRTGSSGNNWYIGQRWDTSSSPYFSGYISNFRFVNGTALYTSNFTPPTAPLTAVTNTVLLTCQSNRFRDNSTNNFAITRTGDVSVQKFTPFIPTSSYDPNVIGGSGYFDGTGDYLNTTGGASFNLSSGDWTVEAWVYVTVSSNNMVLHLFDNVSSNSGLTFYVNSSNQLVVDNGLVAAIAAGTVTTNSWVHIAASRVSGTTTAYVNGTSVGTTTQSPNTAQFANIGILAGGVNYPFNGYISNLRVIKGTGLYTSNFTPSTTPLTAVTNTVLLLNFTNAAIRDNTSFNNLETVGNAQISTTQSKFGGSSLYFDGTGDWLIAPSSRNCSFETGDFTIEGWLYPTVITGTDRCIWETRSASTDAGLVLFIDTNGKLSTFTSNALRLTSTNSLTVNTWQHFALVRSSGTLAFYINGVQNGTLAYTTAITCPGLVRIGVRQDGLQPYTGYIDDLRITKGLARYLGNFTPPTSTFAEF